MSITQSQLAKKLGVSQGTISYAFKPESPVHPKTRTKVLAAANRLGYRPNAAAQAMRKGRFNAIGLLSSVRINEAALNSMALWAVQQEMGRREMHLVMSPIPDEKLLKEGAIPHILRQWSVDGLLVSYTYNAPQPLQDVLERHHVPAVWLNTRLDYDCVYLDDHKAGMLCAQRLLEAGHRRVGYVSFRARASHYSAEDRRRGCLGAVHAMGLHAVEFNHDMLEAARRDELAAITQWLGQPDRPTGIVTYEEGEAAVVLMAAARMGLRVPQDLSICAVRNSSIRVMGVLLSGMEHRHYKLGERGVEQLMKKIDSPADRAKPIVVQPTVVEGETITPPRQMGLGLEATSDTA